ncbi:MAG: DHH family phosphoesterase [Lachnospirales bacterium]
MVEIVKSIVREINKANKIVLSAHTSPDGDAIGSSTALYVAVKNLGKEAYLLMEKPAEKYNMLPFNSEINTETQNIEDVDLFIVLDCGNIKRMEDRSQKLFLKAKKSINIDHHISNAMFGDINLVDVNSSSTSELTYLIIDEMEKENIDIAKLIYSGIVFDTGGFKFDKTSSRTHEIAAKIHQYDFDHTLFYHQMCGNMSLKQFNMLQVVLAKCKIDPEKKIAYVLITLDDFERTNSTKDDFDGVANTFLNIKEVDISLFLYEAKEKLTKCSIRSKGPNVNQVAKCFNGGGHLLASGCVIEEDGLVALNMLLNKINEMI